MSGNPVISAVGSFLSWERKLRDDFFKISKVHLFSMAFYEELQVIHSKAATMISSVEKWFDEIHRLLSKVLLFWINEVGTHWYL